MVHSLFMALVERARSTALAGARWLYTFACSAWRAAAGLIRPQRARLVVGTVTAVFGGWIVQHIDDVGQCVSEIIVHLQMGVHMLPFLIM